MKQDKMILLSVFCACIFIFFSQGSLAAPNFDMEHECENNDCQEGHSINWLLVYDNQGGDVLQLEKVTLKHAVTGKEIAFTEQTFEVGPREQRTLNFSSILPAPDAKNRLFYNVCFTRKVGYEEWSALGYEVNNTQFRNRLIDYCFDDNFTLEMKPANYCRATEECADSEQCLGFRCTDLGCTDCQYVENHTCIDYGCCTSETCEDKEHCLNNTCQVLECTATEVIVNHECIDMECAPDEYKYENSCIELDCANDERAVDHRCVKLYCKRNEIIKDHECVSLYCPMFRKVKDDACATDWLSILIAIFVVGALIIAPVWFSKHGSKKKLSRHQRHCPECDSVLGPRDTFCYNCKMDLKKHKEEHDKKEK